MKKGPVKRNPPMLATQEFSRRAKVLSVAPGKIILTGEHSVVHGEPALLATIDKEVRVSIEETGTPGIKVIAPQLQIDNQYIVDEVVEYWQEANRARNKYIEEGDIKDWQKFSKDQQVVLKACLGLFVSENKDLMGVKIIINSAMPVGSGLGSSASVASALLGGLYGLRSKKISKPELYEKTYLVEQIVHGRASGADPAAVIYGGCLMFQKTEEKKSFKSYKLPKYKGTVCLLDTGKPSETTGEMVSALAEKLKTQRLKLKTMKAIEKIGELSQKVIADVKRGTLNWEWVEENEGLLEELGVVGMRARKILRDLKKKGVTAKVCGAGGVKGGSGIALAYHPDEDKLKYAVTQLNLPNYQVRLGVRGWRIE